MADLSAFDLTGKKALVTGGAGGIGRACAIGMAKAGAVSMTKCRMMLPEIESVGGFTTSS